MSGTLDQPGANPSPQPRPKHEVLTLILRERGWSQADLARAAGVDQNAVSRLMLLKYDLLYGSQVAAMAAVCGVHPLELVPFEWRESHPRARPHAEPEVEVPFSDLIAAGERIPEPTWSPEDEDRRARAEEEVRMALSRGGLNHRDAMVVHDHFGLGQNPIPSTTAQLASSLGCSRQRVSQIQKRALDRLRLIIACMRGQDPRPPGEWRDAPAASATKKRRKVGHRRKRAKRGGGARSDLR